MEVSDDQKVLEYRWLAERAVIASKHDLIVGKVEDPPCHRDVIALP